MLSILGYIVEQYLSKYSISYEFVLILILFFIPFMIFNKNTRKYVIGFLTTCLSVFTILCLNHYKIISLNGLFYDSLISMVRFGLEIIQVLSLEFERIISLIGTSRLVLIGTLSIFVVSFEFISRYLLSEEAIKVMTSIVYDVKIEEESVVYYEESNNINCSPVLLKITQMRC